MDAVTPPFLSVVIPCYNEEPVLPTLHARLTKVCAALNVSYEIVLVNDGSRDQTWETMLELAEHDPHLVCLNLSRNHGHQLALTAGLSVCVGEHVLIIDADLQDPPEILPDMLALMKYEKADVVYGRRIKREGETVMKKLTAHLFYRLLGQLTDTPIPTDTGDFRLVTRRVVEQFLAMPERHRFVRGMISWLGFKQLPFPYERHPRAAGETHYTFWKMWKFAWDAVTGFSTRPLTLPFRVGTCCVAVAFLIWMLAGVQWARTDMMPSTGLLGGLLFFLAGGQFLTLGVIGEYLGRMYAEIRGRPMFVIDRVVHGRAAPAALPIVRPEAA